MVAAITLLGCGGAGRDLGEACDTSGECSDKLQCLDRVCVPRCVAHVDCGDGALCNDGECQAVISAIGDECESELSCGPGQTCRLPTNFADEPSCQAETSGPLEGERCTPDAGCRAGVCSLGRCINLCRLNNECRRGWTCAKIPGPPQDFDGCLPGNATIEFEVEVETPPNAPAASDVVVLIPVPSTARSMVLLFEAQAADQWVGASGLVGPQPRAQVLYRRAFDAETYYANPVRHTPLPGVSVIQVPSSTAARLEAGIYSVAVTRFRLTNSPVSGEGVMLRDPGPHPRLRVIEKLGSAARLDLHFYFRDLTDHPCTAAMGGPLDAASAQSLAGFQGPYLETLQGIFSAANIRLGEITYTDHDTLFAPSTRPEFDVLEAGDAASLFARPSRDTGVSIYFVRSIEPDGQQILTGGTPGAPIGGTGASGIAIAADTLCYRDWQELARQTAHGIARHMGLYRNVEPDNLPGHVDPIADSDNDILNLMHYSERGGTILSLGQREILRASPVLR